MCRTFYPTFSLVFKIGHKEGSWSADCTAMTMVVDQEEGFIVRHVQTNCKPFANQALFRAFAIRGTRVAIFQLQKNTVMLGHSQTMPELNHKPSMKLRNQGTAVLLTESLSLSARSTSGKTTHEVWIKGSGKVSSLYCYLRCMWDCGVFGWISLINLCAIASRRHDWWKKDSRNFSHQLWLQVQFICRHPHHSLCSRLAARVVAGSYFTQDLSTWTLSPPSSPQWLGQTIT